MIDNKSNVIIGKFQYHEQISILKGNVVKAEEKLGKEDRKVLIIHTGGTIGMFNSPEGYKPQRDRFKTFLKSYPYFCDSQETFFQSHDDFVISPVTIYGRRIWFKLLEMKTIIDSSNMNNQYWKQLLAVLKEHYQNFDAFIILHGTDSMSYTASALSFMIENLSKTIILTGAQIPISETRNDSINNLMCSLVIAGHFTIPEVLVVFDSKLLRGNRCKKQSTSSLNTFGCPNFRRLGHFGLTIEIEWDFIIPPAQDNHQTVNFVELDVIATSSKLTPYTFVIPTHKYIVLQTYGCGNIPTYGIVYQWLKTNAKLPEEQRQIIVNISQVENSQVIASYQGGVEAMRLGVIKGGDMTLECAMAKLSYLASKKYSYLQITKKIGQNLRGQLSEKSEHSDFVNILNHSFQNHKDEFKRLLKQKIFIKLASERITPAIINKIVELGSSLNSVNHEGKALIHELCNSHTFDSMEVIECLMAYEIELNNRDQSGNSALYYALLNKKHDIAEYLYSKGAKILTTARNLYPQIKAHNCQLLISLHQMGDEFDYKDTMLRNVAMYALHVKCQPFVEYLKSKTNLFKNLDRDKRGKTIHDYNTQYTNNKH